MTLDPLIGDMLRNMEAAFAWLEKRVPAPQRVPYKDRFVFRYADRTVHQVLVQKLARLLSDLRAARILLAHGFFQEQAALQRMLDEFREDIMFLSLGVIMGEITDLHREYLDAFYEEEFDNEDPLKATQRRPMIPRKRIRAYIANIDGTVVDRSTGTELLRTLSKAYSGFVHGASPQIMEMYGGSPARFDTAGMLGTPARTSIARTSGTTFIAASSLSPSLPWRLVIDWCLTAFDSIAKSLRDYPVGMMAVDLSGKPDTPLDPAAEAAAGQRQR